MSGKQTCISMATLLLVAMTATHAVDAAVDPNVKGFIDRYCVDCHSGSTPEAGLSLVSSDVSFDDREVRRRRSFLFDRVARGEMPPKEAQQPGAGARRDFLRALGEALSNADLKQREVVLRRLNRGEYTNSVSDLFGVHVDVSRLLLDDSTERGFDNTGSEMSISTEQMNLFVEAADVVLDQVFGPRQPPRIRDSVVNLATSKRSTAGESERKLADGVVLFSGAKSLPIYEAAAHAVGLYQYSVKVRAEQSSTPVVMQITGGGTGAIAGHSIGHFEVPPGRVTTIEFTDRAKEPSDSIGIRLSGGYPQYSVPAGYKGPGLFIGDFTVKGPIDEWTPARKRLFGSIDPAKGTLADLRSILVRVATRAFRRSVVATEVDPYVSLASQAIDEGRSFEAALRLALKGVLCAPEFLYLEEPLTSEKRISDFALASRLSYFLWCSLPDDQLLKLARQGQLHRPEVLNAQIARLLADEKSSRFVNSFVGQWLRVNDIDFTVPERRLYPEYNGLLRQSMIDESNAFFREILDNDLSVENFIDSDFLMLNQPLAEFYGINGVTGLKMRRVARPVGSLRGGVMTQASVLKVSADGTRTSPVLRGVWIQHHLFGEEVPPPPPSVKIVQPDIRGATTIREQLEKHREDPSCSRCHNRIDPPGFALESFDVIGGQRDWYRTRGQGGKYLKLKLHPFWQLNVQYQQGPPVDSSGATADGRTFTDVREYKQLLLADKMAMVRSLTRLLMSYSMGRRLGFSDRTEVEEIVSRVRQKNDGLRSLLSEVVLSETFRMP